MSIIEYKTDENNKRTSTNKMYIATEQQAQLILNEIKKYDFGDIDNDTLYYVNIGSCTDAIIYIGDNGRHYRLFDFSVNVENNIISLFQIHSRELYEDDGYYVIYDKQGNEVPVDEIKINIRQQRLKDIIAAL